MHVGNFLRAELEKRGITKAHAGRMMNKTGTAIEKDFTKPALHQEVIEGWSKFLGINIFKMIANEFEGKPAYPDLSETEPSMVAESSEPIKTSAPEKKEIEILSVNIAVPADKQEAILKLLIS